jgi:acetoin utilization deacetylase AcuC-like enzyme
LIVFHSPIHVLHDPEHELWGGKLRRHPEVPARAEVILDSLAEEGHEVREPDPMRPGELLKVHSRGYIDHLLSTCRGLGPSLEAFPFVFPDNDYVPSDPVARRGRFSYDTVTPLRRGTYDAALGSASCALSGAREIERSCRLAYCLCRPPGHHARWDRMGGYCYLNNAAIAADHLRSARTAVLDIDSHHGNGTQEIFYSTDEVLFCSVHGDPADRFPYSWGFGDEEGEGDGMGYNLNLPLDCRASGTDWIEAVALAVERIRSYDPRFIVVSLGVDGLKEDDNGPFLLEVDDFTSAGRLVHKLDTPTCVIQEGGYHLPLMGECVRGFLSGCTGRSPT